jgi:hypothetical protein
VTTFRSVSNPARRGKASNARALREGPVDLSAPAAPRVTLCPPGVNRPQCCDSLPEEGKAFVYDAATLLTPGASPRLANRRV